MIAPSLPPNEHERLAELYRYELLDTAYEQEFDEIVKIASYICKTPISIITLVDADRQWFKAKIGLDARQTERDVAFCAHAIASDNIFEVTDALLDERFVDNPLVTGDPKIRYYAGVPLITEHGYRLGTLCVIDTLPRHLDEEQLQMLKMLSKQVIKLMVLRLKNKEWVRITEVKDKIMAIMAHDIRSPLASLLSFYELKADSLFTEEELLIMEQSIPAQLQNTIDLLSSVVEWGKLLEEPTDNIAPVISVQQVANQCFEYISLAAVRKSNKLLNFIPEDFTMRCNESGLSFILRNLVANANKFTTNGTIAISAKHQGDFVKLMVVDTGLGIEPNILKQLNNNNNITTTTGTDNEKGSGVGLKLVADYLISINGQLEFESKQDVGTTVVVLLPNR